MWRKGTLPQLLVKSTGRQQKLMLHTMQHMSRGFYGRELFVHHTQLVVDAMQLAMPPFSALQQCTMPMQVASPPSGGKDQAAALQPATVPQSWPATPHSIFTAGSRTASSTPAPAPASREAASGLRGLTPGSVADSQRSCDTPATISRHAAPSAPASIAGTPQTVVRIAGPHGADTANGGTFACAAAQPAVTHGAAGHLAAAHPGATAGQTARVPGSKSPDLQFSHHAAATSEQLARLVHGAASGAGVSMDLAFETAEDVQQLPEEIRELAQRLRAGRAGAPLEGLAGVDSWQCYAELKL